MKITFKDLEPVINEVFIEPEKISENTSYEDIPEWDSMLHVNLIYAIEEKFDIQVPDDRIIELNSIPNIIGYINEVFFEK